jgi:prepilin-type N-terminal cleavage/methylation domain-containing protein
MMLQTSYRRTRRRGLSLLEILVALTIFLMAFVVLGRLVILGGDRAGDTQWQNQAVQLCECKMDELAAGIFPLQSQAAAPIAEAPDWQWAVNVQQTNVPNLYQVNVQVSHQGFAASRISYSLSQMMLDPRLRGNILDGTLTVPPDIDPNNPSDSGGGSPSGNSPSSSSRGGR